MTKAEQALFDAAIAGERDLSEYRHAVFVERLTPDFVELAVPVCAAYLKAKGLWERIEDQLRAAGQINDGGMWDQIYRQGQKLSEVADAS